MSLSERFKVVGTEKKQRLNVLPSYEEEIDEGRSVGLGRFPSWLHRPLPSGSALAETGMIIDDLHLHTVCEEARCPNRLECWSKKTATFLIMGKQCTRNCGFCSIDFNKTPQKLDDDEPQRIAESVKKLQLRHVVITMVARDDLPDGGAAHLGRVVSTIRTEIPETTIEVLTSDFEGNTLSLAAILAAEPDIFNHNIETVRELTPRVRHKATYERTLMVLKQAHDHRQNKKMLIKSGLMVGLGETPEQVKITLDDLASAGCNIVTIGQYLQADHRKLLVKSFVTPEQFKEYEHYGHSIGIKTMYCGPFVRSSYNAGEVMQHTQE